jgi:hypothetical protein
VSRVDEIVPGLWRWTAPHPARADQHIDCQLTSRAGTAQVVVEDQGFGDTKAATIAAARAACASLLSNGWSS